MKQGGDGVSAMSRKPSEPLPEYGGRFSLPPPAPTTAGGIHTKKSPTSALKPMWDFNYTDHMVSAMHGASVRSQIEVFSCAEVQLP